MGPEQHTEDQAAYITIIEGPPPEFAAARRDWTASLAEGQIGSLVVTCEMRTFNGQSLVARWTG